MNIVKVWQRQFWKQKKQSLPFCKKQVPKQNLYHPYQVHQACVLVIGTDCYCRYNCLRNLDISKTYENRNNHSKYFEVFFLSRKWHPNETCNIPNLALNATLMFIKIPCWHSMCLITILMFLIGFMLAMLCPYYYSINHIF